MAETSLAPEAPALLLLVDIVHERVEVLDPSIVLHSVQLPEEQVDCLLRIVDATRVQGLRPFPSSSKNVNTLNGMLIWRSTVSKIVNLHWIVEAVESVLCEVADRMALLFRDASVFDAKQRCE